MKSLVVLILTALLCFSALLGNAQRENVSQFNAWLVYMGTHKLSKRTDLYTDFQYRRNEFLINPLQLQIRAALDYKLPMGVKISPAYVFTFTSPYGKQTPTSYEFSEHRPFEQLAYKSKLGRLDVFHRYRLEQRFIELKSLNGNGDFVIDKWEFRHRIRYRLLVNLPLNNKELIDKTFFMQFWDELFIGFGKNVKKNMFDQNRLFGGFGYRFNAKTSIVTGYLYQGILKSDGVRFENNHTFFLSCTYNVDFTKKD